VVGIFTVWALNWVAAGIGITVWGLGVGTLRLMAKADPILRHVYPRALRYKRYYPARSTPWRKPPSSSWFSVVRNALSLQSHAQRTHY
jgi:type IV secretion system protein VirB3